jgi:hypothetical protein
MSSAVFVESQYACKEPGGGGKAAMEKRRIDNNSQMAQTIP